MNKRIYLIVFSILLLSCRVSRSGPLKLSGKSVVARHEWTSDHITGLEVHCADSLLPKVTFNIDITKGDKYSLEMRCDEILLPYILLDEYLHILTLELNYPIDDNLYLDEGTVIDITLILPELTDIYAETESYIDISSITEFNSINLYAQYGVFKMASDIEVLESTYLYSKLENLRSITGSLIQISNSPTENSVRELNGEEITLRGSFDLDSISGDAVSLSGEINVDELRSTTLELEPEDELSISYLRSNHITLNYRSQASVTLPVRTTIDKTTIRIDSVSNNIDLESLDTKDLEITLSNETSLSITQLEADNIDIKNYESSISLPTSLDCQSINIEVENGLINMSGETDYLNISMVDNYSFDYVLYLPNLNSVDCELEIGRYNELSIGTVDNLIYTLDDNTILHYLGTPTSESGTLGDNNITINNVEVK